VDKRQVLKVIVAHSQAGAWVEAQEICLQAAQQFPDDAGLRTLLDGLSVRASLFAVREALPNAPVVVASAPVLGVSDVAVLAPVPPPASPLDPEASSRAFLDEAVRRRIDREGMGADSMTAVMQNSRRISDVLHAAATRHMDEDVEALLAAARTCLGQDLLQEAMRLCQKVTAQDPENEQVKVLLRDIYRRKGL